MQEMSESGADRSANPTRKLFLVLGVVVGVLLVCGVASLWLRNYFADQAVKAELAKAKAAGMLTTLEDVKKFIGPAPEESENAAPFYRRMTELSQTLKFGNMEDIWSNLFASPTSKTMVDAKQLINDNSELITLAEQAVEREFCFFDHDWSRGHSITFPHVAPAKLVSRLLLIRSLIAYSEGRKLDAMTDIRRVRAISRHIAQDRVPITTLVSSSISILAIRTVAHLAGQEGPNSIWLNELEAIGNDIDAPTYRDVVALDLYFDLVLFEAVKSKDKRADIIGFKEDEKPEPQYNLIAATISAQEGERLMISGRLQVWNAFDNQDSINWQEVRQGLAKVTQGYLSDPYLIMIAQGLSLGEIDYIRTPRERFLEYKLLIKAALRVLRQKDRRQIPDLSDLGSPTNGQNVTGEIADGKVILTVENSSTSSDSLSQLQFRIAK